MENSKPVRAKTWDEMNQDERLEAVRKEVRNLFQMVKKLEKPDEKGPWYGPLQ